MSALSSQQVPSPSKSSNLAKIIAMTFALLTMWSLALTSLAQQSSTQAAADASTNPQTAPSTTQAPPVTVTIPGGTRIVLVLTHPIQSRYIHHGDDIYAQISSPVTSEKDVTIPAGTFVQGKVDKLELRGGRGELRLQSMSITFPDGYVTSVAGPVTLESPEGYALKDPGKGRIAGTIALPAAGLGLGALIGHSVASSQPSTITNSLPPGCTGPPPGCLSSSLTAPGSTAKSTVIGVMVGGAIGGVAALALIFNTHNFFLDVGSPVEMVLQNPLTVEQDEVAAAIRDIEQNPEPEQPIAPRPQAVPPSPSSDPGICYTPGSPGTPDIDIPGTPAVGGSPGTPPTHIPGTPATPPTSHPCP